MQKETLQKGNELLKLISEHESALLCFEYDANYFENYCKSENEELLPPKMESTNPKLIIEYDSFDDDWYREKQEIPIKLSDFLINIIKEQIKESLAKLKKEFDEL